jgi:ParB family chromosome partitioning protein
MSNKRGQWLARRRQADVAVAIDQVIDQQPQRGEQVRQVPDELIEDSPYQARQSLDETSLEELAQGMREVGFQGVLIIRPHGDPAQRRRGSFQLVYGHRRRAAWRRVCTERGERCAVPVVVREVTDERMLTIGAQENLQRADLTPLEEAQIVAWHEKTFYPASQAVIGRMLGKSESWVKTRSRIHRLPDALKDRLRARPGAISQILELGVFYEQQPMAAVTLANRVVQEHMTLNAVRATIREYTRPFSTVKRDRDELHNTDGAVPVVAEITNDAPLPHTPAEQGTKVFETSLDDYKAPSFVEAFYPAWATQLCEHIEQITVELRHMPREVSELDDATTQRLMQAVETLLHELARLAQTLEGT